MVSKGPLCVFAYALRRISVPLMFLDRKFAGTDTYDQTNKRSGWFYIPPPYPFIGTNLLATLLLHD